MKTINHIICFLFVLTLVSVNNQVSAQIVPSPEENAGSNTSGLPNLGRLGGFTNVKKDSLGNAISDWDDVPARIYFTTPKSKVLKTIDSSISHFHHYQPTQPWWGKDLGNYSTATRNLLFSPLQKPGLHLGYNAYDLYKLNIDNLPFFNTTRPYTDFTFLLGSKKEQHVGILHTQNISPNWNVAGFLKQVSSPGFYKFQKTKSFAGGANTIYSSDNQRYVFKAALVFQNYQQEENGGVTTDSLFQYEDYSNRQLMPVKLPSKTNNKNLAAVSNTLRDWDFYIDHLYAAVGVHDTLYNEDSTSMKPIFTPRFTLRHRLHMHSQKQTFKDLNPETERYDFLDRPILFAVSDSIKAAHTLLFIDNKFGLQGTLGKEENLADLEIGIANKIDRFAQNTFIDKEVNTFVSNYIYGSLSKEAYKHTQWNYTALAEFYFSGPALGNFLIKGNVGKELSEWLALQAGVQQSLTNAPYSYQYYQTSHYKRNFDLNPYSITNVYGALSVPKYQFYLKAANYLLANYIYFNDSLQIKQQAEAFSLMQISAQKNFNLGIFHLDNEAVWQQATNNAPLNLPAIMLRHQLRIETPLFKKALHFSTGIELRYHTAYYADGYTPYFNQFYYQNTQLVNNKPELAAFFNFKVRRFRGFVIGDQLQQLFWKNNINAPGYYTPNTLVRFGFSWVLIN